MRTVIVAPIPAGNASSQAASRFVPPEGVAGPLDTWVPYPAKASGHGFAPMVAAVRLGHSTYNGSYSWLLSGDDDTVFITENVLEMLRTLQLDPSVPYAITDDVLSAQTPPAAVG